MSKRISIEVGDTVELLSGGPEMTVELVETIPMPNSSEGIWATCLWFDLSFTALRKDRLKVETLKVVMRDGTVAGVS